ncbi:MAG: hypothetical protein Q9227_006370 [Pyrenula ochraceoflavens]
MAAKSSFSLEPASREDIPRLAEIHVIACLPDNAFKLYFATAAEFKARVIDMLNGQVGESDWLHLKAVDYATGKLAAWASWHTPSDRELRERAAQTDAAQKPSDKGPGKGDFDFPPGLPQLVQDDTDRWINRWAYRRRHMRCLALFTDPAFQRRGMGTALVEYGNRLADEKTLPIFLQGSPYGFPIYKRAGFETVQHLDVDLREWAPGAREGDRGFGSYRFRYMLRLPMTVPDETE